MPLRDPFVAAALALPNAINLFQDQGSAVAAQAAAEKAVGDDGVLVALVEADFAQSGQAVGEAVADGVFNGSSIADGLFRIVRCERPASAGPGRRA